MRIGKFVMAAVAGAVLALVGVDYVQLKFFPENFEKRAMMCEDKLAAYLQKESNCVSNLNFCQTVIGDNLERARLVQATKMQTIDLIRSSMKGDKEASKQLEVIGWTPEMAPAGRRIVQNYDELSKTLNGQGGE